MIKETDPDSFSYEITLRAVGQALEALMVESFELVVDGDNFRHLWRRGGEFNQTTASGCESAFQLFGWSQKKIASPRPFYISGMQLRESDVQRLDDQGKELRISVERCPDTDRLSHALRMIGAHIDKSRMILLGIQRNKRVLPFGTKGVGELA